MWRTFSLIFIFCAVFVVNCRKYNNNADYSRNKRPKYYSTLPYKYYNRPTHSSYNKNPILYNPPPGYSPNDIGPPVSPNLKPYQVSKRPINDGLGDEDFHNLINYLSKQDLDKIVEIAAEKERYTDQYRDSLYNYAYGVNDLNNNENNIFKNIGYDEDIVNNPSGPNVQLDNNFERDNRNTIYPYDYPQWQGTLNTVYSQIPINTEELEEIDQFSSLNIGKEINQMSSDRDNIFTDSSTMGEELLPKPLNLREYDYDVAFTNNVPSLAKPETSYRLENFADLPLMEYQNSKLDTVSSYNVPHYTVTSSNQIPRYASSDSRPPSSVSSSSPSSSILSLLNAPKVEPAPPAPVAKEQSDAHLKAIKIWTHRSKGTAYTLHDDGTLSLEGPAKPRYKKP